MRFSDAAPVSRHLPQGPNQSGNLFQSEEDVRWLPGETSRLKRLENENARLKILVAGLIGSPKVGRGSD
jgi:hypothetical protein